MLEAQIDLRRANINGAIGSKDTAKKKAGDIIVVKRAGSPWSDLERKYFLIVKFKNADIEAYFDEVEANLDKGDNVICSYPYAKYSEDENGQPVMVNRCTKTVDLDMYEGSPGLDPDDLTADPVSPNGKNNLEALDLVVDESDR